jgi:hypothetical protein
MRQLVCGAASLLLAIAISGQILAGATFPVVKFRASEPRAFWTVVGLYGCLLLIVVVTFLMWR